MMERLTTTHEFHKKAVVKHVIMVLSSGKQKINQKNNMDDLTERAVKILPNKKSSVTFLHERNPLNNDYIFHILFNYWK